MSTPIDDSPDMFRRVIRALNVAYWEWTPGTTEVRVSTALAELLAFDPGNWSLDRMYNDWMHPDDRAPYRTALIEFLKSGAERAEFSARFLRGDGGFGWATTHNLVERDATGRAVRMTGTLSDITAQKEQEARNRTYAARQAASIEVLKAIAASPDDPQPVFDLIARHARELCDAQAVVVHEYDGELMHLRAMAGHDSEAAARLRQAFPRPAGEETMPGRALLSARMVRIENLSVEPGIFQQGRDLGAGTSFSVPLLRDGIPIGVISLFRFSVRPYDATEIAMVESFAEQAVIAIASARTLRELRERTAELAERNDAFAERIEQQSATIDVLKVMSSTPDDTQPVFEQIVRRAKELCNAVEATLFQYDGELVHHSAVYGDTYDPTAPECIAYVNSFPMVPTRGSISCRAILDKQVIHVRDTDADLELSSVVRDLFRQGGLRSQLSIPLMRDGVALGAITLNAKPAGGFTDSQVALLQTFAEQAVIAIGSTETYRALQDRTAALALRNSEFGERIEQQASTIDVLKAMSSTRDDPRPVFDLIVKRALPFCEADFVGIGLVEDGTLHLQAHIGLDPARATTYAAAFPRPVDSSTVFGRVVLGGDIVRIPDSSKEPGYVNPTGIPTGRAASIVGVPIVRDGESIGAITLARKSVGEFSASQIDLLETFAEQAAIAIASAETYRDLRRSLEQQTATAEVLQVINASAGELQPVFDTMLEKAMRLCDAAFGHLALLDGDTYRSVAKHNIPASLADFAREPVRFAPNTAIARIAQGETLIQIEDVAADVITPLTSPGRRTLVTEAGARTTVWVALRKDDVTLGCFNIYRQEVRPFTSEQIALLQNFAAQAVIAIENARLLGELRERTAALAERNDAFAERIDQQAATIDVLKVMASAPGDVRPVFELITQRAAELCESRAVLVEFDGTQFHTPVLHGFNADAAAAFSRRFPEPFDAASERRYQQVVNQRRMVHHLDNAPADGVNWTLDGSATLALPLMRDGMPIGVIGLNGSPPGGKGFSGSQIALLQTFAEQAVIAITSAETYRALQERTAALALRNSEFGERIEQQAATIDVLRSMSASPGDAQPVFEMIAQRAQAFCEADGVAVTVLHGDTLHLRTHYGATKDLAAEYESFFPLPVDASTTVGRAILTRAPAHNPDLHASAGYLMQGTARSNGLRSNIFVPMLRDGVPVGAIGIGRYTPGEFPAAQIELLTTFAEQAAIAAAAAETFQQLEERTAALTLRNSEFGERIEQQAATIDVLKTMSASPEDATPVFDQIVSRAKALCDAPSAALTLFDGRMLSLAAQTGMDVLFGRPDGAELFARQFPRIAGLDTTQGRAVLTGEVAQNEDPNQDPRWSMARTDTNFSNLAVPLLRDGKSVGAIVIARLRTGPFSAAQIALLKTFAEQAVIAIGGAATYRALQERTAALALRNSEFGERIEQQASTIDVLKKMSSTPDDTKPVFDLIAARAAQLCESRAALVELVDGEIHLRAIHGFEPDVQARYERSFPVPLDPNSARVIDRAILERRTVHIPDVRDDPRNAATAQTRILAGTAIVGIPLLRDGEAIGVIGLNGSPPGGKGFSDSQIALLQTFAEQAVIAITSTETYRALQERTAALALRNSEFGERIEQQASTIDVLKAMSSTPDDTQPVFDLITARAAQLCESRAGLFELVDGVFHLRALHGFEPDVQAQYERVFPSPLDSDGSRALDRAVLGRRTFHVPSFRDDPQMAGTATVRMLAGNSAVTIPLLRDGEPIGVIGLSGNPPGGKGYSDSQIALLQTFAEQAVIAIGSVATFRALRERTAELTRSVAELQALEEVLRAVNSSLDLETVLSTIISRAVRLSDADEGTIYEFDETEEAFILKSTYGMPEARVALLRESRIRMGETHLGRAAVARAPVHVSDVQQDPTLPDSAKAVLVGIHAVLAVPLLRDDKVVGGLVIRRRTVGDFPSSIPTLLQTFAGQSVLAIENARLFQQLAERGEEARRARVAAETALSDLRRTQDRLLQTEKLASLGQLTAGIAHEIKNPLNFVNNFSDLSVDLLNELNEAVAPDRLTVAADLRAEIDDITTTLKLNLEKIAHHGRRADSIVKNMLLHSRTGASEHRMIALNSMVEEALNLAYHGERAKTPGFNITMETDLDPEAGSIDAFPQEISRVLLNLIGNGFYAAHKRGIDPTLKVSTRDRGDLVEIRVRDNGTGIPEAERERIFEPFFTTKPAGEGTGLGLSLSFDIVVKQHGGSLTVDSRIDSFTEFTIVLPRRIAEGAAP